MAAASTGALQGWSCKARLRCLNRTRLQPGKASMQDGPLVYCARCPKLTA